MSDERLTVDKLNDDGVVFLIMCIFDESYYKYLTARTNLASAMDPLETAFGGGLQIGNSHNGDYQLGISTAHDIVRRFTKYY